MATPPRYTSVKCDGLEHFLNVLLGSNRMEASNCERHVDGICRTRRTSLGSTTCCFLMHAFESALLQAMLVSRTRILVPLPLPSSGRGDHISSPSMLKASLRQSGLEMPNPTCLKDLASPTVATFLALMGSSVAISTPSSPHGKDMSSPDP